MDRTLAKLAEKHEPRREYSISEGDLVAVERCAVCGSVDTAPVARVYLNRRLMFFETSVCAACLYTFRSLSPSYRWFRERWREISTGSPEVFNSDIEDLRRRRYKTYLDLVRPYAPAGRVLDIGAAFGSGSQVFRDAGYDVEALEPEDDRALYLRDRLGLRTHATVLNEFEADNAYDVILFAHVLEHVDDPVELLARVRRWLNPGRGVLYLEVPLLWNIVDFRDSMFLAHKSNFSERNLSDLTRRVGLSVLHTCYPCLNAETPDIGLVLALALPGEAPGPEHAGDIDDRSVADVKRLYRRGLPVRDDRTDDVLCISVPRISHFYYTVRYDEGRFVDNRSISGFIEFKPEEHRP
jgi:SAM-dependent methyltransferase